MKKLSFLCSLLCASLFSFADAPVNYALASNGSSAEASSGNAALAIDGDNGTRWESASTDDETWTLNMGQARTFNTIKILWEGAYCTEFTLSYSTDGTNYTLWHNETELAAAGWQTIYKETPVTAQYIQYHGTKRATGYGQSFYEFQVMEAEAPREYTQITGLTIVANSEGENDVNRVIDGNNGTEWQGRPAGVTGGDEESRTFDAWFVVDLGGFYTVEKVDIMFEGACAQDYHLDFSVDNTNWSLGYNYVGTAGINGRTDEVIDLDNNQKVRYVRFWSTKAGTEWGMKIFEFRVYGKEWKDTGDTEAPVMVSAELSSKTWNSAVIAVSATDNGEVVKFRVVDAAKEIDVKCNPNDGKITVSGLTAETQYTFTITAIDAADNESENNKVVSLTTDAHALAPAAKAADPTWPLSQVKAIYSPTYNADCNFQEWGSGTTYAQEEFGKKYIVGNNGNGYFGVDGFSLNCINMEKLHYDIWIADDATLRIVPICRNAADDGNEPEYGVTVSLKGQQWNSVDLSLSEDQFANVTNWSNVYQVKIDNAANLTFWVGNAFFYRATALEDNEKPTDVTASLASASYFSATLTVSAKDNSGAVSFIVLDGDNEVATASGASGATVNVVVPNLLPNTDYHFSVVAKDDAGNEAEAVAVAAKTLEAPAPAQAPAYEADKVLGVFTDNYTSLNISIQDWWAMPTVVKGALSANSSALCITPNATANSCFGLAFAAQDITAYTALELDVYPLAENAVLDIQVIGVGAAATSFNLKVNEWNHIVLNIFGNTKTDCEQIGFYNCNNLLDVCFVQNVLFAQNETVTGVESTQANATAATKILRDGQLFILRDGKIYTIHGTAY